MVMDTLVPCSGNIMNCVSKLDNGYGHSGSLSCSGNIMSCVSKLDNDNGHSGPNHKTH